MALNPETAAGASVERGGAWRINCDTLQLYWWFMCVYIHICMYMYMYIYVGIHIYISYDMIVYRPGVSVCPVCNVSRLDEGPKPWYFSYRMTVSTCLDMVLGMIEKGFAIWECCKGLRRLVFQNSFFARLMIFNQCHSLTGVGFNTLLKTVNHCNNVPGVGDLILY